MSSPESFNPWIKRIHGLMAVAMIAAIAIILYADELPKGPDKWELYFWHKSIGFALGLLVIGRIITVLQLGKPEPLGHGLQKLAAVWGHRLLYLTMMIMPVSGLTMSYAGGHSIPFFGLFTIPGAEEKLSSLGGIAHEVHEITGNIIIALIVIHVAAGFYHHFVMKDDTLKRMFGKGT